ncbi:MAG: PAS domain-containing protein, partial [Acidobacteria bacterium]|nr:PAS domain-containing protein [Acidobacteriota bacterium]
MSELILQLSAEGDVMWASPSLKELLGWEPESLRGRRLDDLLVDDALSVAWRPARWEAGETLRTPFALRHRDGSARRGRARLYRVPGPGDAIGTVIAVMRGFSASGDVVVDQELHQLLADNVVDVVSIIEGTGRIAWITPNVESVLGRPPADVVGHLFSEFVLTEDLAVLAASLTLILSGEAVHFEVRTRQLDHSVRSIAVASHLVDVPGLTQARVAIWRDVTE